MTEKAYEAIFPYVTELTVDLTNDNTLGSSAVGKIITVNPVGSAYKALRTPDESVFSSPVTIANGSATAFLIFSRDWTKLHCKVNNGGSIKIGFSGGSYSYTNKTSLASIAHLDREDLSGITYDTSWAANGMTSGYAVKLTTNRIAMCWNFSSSATRLSGTAVCEYDTTSSIWRYSTAATHSQSAGSNNPSGSADARICAIDSTHYVVWDVTSSSDGSFPNHRSNSGFSAKMYTVTPLSSPTAPSIAAGSNLAIASWDSNWGCDGSGFPGGGNFVCSRYAISSMGYPSLIGTTVCLPVNYTTNFSTSRAGVVVLTYNTGAGTLTYSNVYDWYTNAGSIHNGFMWLCPIPSTTKGIIFASDTTNSNKPRAAVFTGSGFGTTIDVATHNVTTVDDTLSIICPDATKAIATYRNATAVSGGTKNQVVAKSITVTAASNTLSADGTETVLFDGTRDITRVKPFIESSSAFGFCYSYTDKVVAAGGVGSEGVETWTWSSTTLTRRGQHGTTDASAVGYIRQTGTSGFVFYASGSLNPNVYSYLTQKGSDTTRQLATFLYEDGAGKITQRSDGSVIGGYVRTA